MPETMNNKNQEIIIYKTDDQKVELKVKLEKETVWLDAHLIAQLFGVNRPAIVKHIGNIYKDEELSKESTCSKMEQVAADGRKRLMNLYNLDVIIAVGYRVNSKRATQFRIWATNVLRDHVVKGYTINEQRLMEQGKKFEDLQKAVKTLTSVISKKELNRKRGKREYYKYYPITTMPSKF